ncbi:hypothetical protein SASPL_152477 [Salvia splendens]|uniref:Rab3 GTPase-activating protein non-catalytic subunit n=1 Tax=Salvia splendens TaxID=180675 RepID=A0A8X8W383_SALSN|nr:hypothetical protein SASPL_152477 [Salvia splendens]
MSRRNHTTELGSIASADLSAVGAGKQGWLVENPNLLVSLDTNSIALANRSSIFILNWSQSINGGSDTDPNRASKIIPELSPIEAEYISAVEWLVFDDDIRVLAVGTSCGYLMIFSIHGRLILRQIVNPAKILKIRVRGIKQDLTQDTSSEEVCVVMPGVVARFDGSDIKSLLQQWFQESGSQGWDRDFNMFQDNSGNPVRSLPYQLWNVSKYGVCADAAITGVMPPPLMEIQSSQRYYCAVTIGDDAVISAFRFLLDLFSDNVTLVPASPLTCLKDHPRKGEKLTLSPSGSLAAITDSLGRILLLDTKALVVVRLWKGYRDASCLFVEMLASKDQAASRPAYNEHTKSDYCLCLAIHAPRKGIVERAASGSAAWSPPPLALSGPLRKTSQGNVSVYMGNIVDTTYTGIYHVNLTFHFYPTARDVSGSPADLILPISRAPPLNNGEA